MEGITVRPALISDLDILLQFEQGVISAERPFDPTIRQGKTHYYDIPEMIAAPHIRLVVAEAPGGIAGCGYARIENAKPFLQHKQHAYLGFMYLLPPLRGKGINRLIIDALKQWCLSMKITELRLDVYANNKSAIIAYEKAGFNQHMIEMRTDISQTGSI